MHYLSFSAWFNSLSIMYSRFIHAATWFRASFLFNVEKYSTVCICHILLIYSYILVDIWIVSIFVGHCEQCSYEHQYTKILFESLLSFSFFFFEYIPRNGTAGSYLILCLSFWRTAILFSTVAIPFYIAASSAQGFWYRHIPINTFFFPGCQTS